MENPPSTETVLQGVHALYNNPDLKEKDKASAWLAELQKSIHSWKIADQLLQEKRDLHSCYFAAQTMRNKIQNSFHELPPTAHESLRDSLLEHISHITPETNQIIVTQLCLALADLILLMSAWRHPIASLIERFATNTNSVTALIVILTLIPEEIESRNLRLGANRRDEMSNELAMNSRRVAEFLQTCLINRQQDETIHAKIIKCFTSWTSMNVFKLEDIIDNMVLSYAFNLLRNPSTGTNMHEIAADCLCALLTCLEMTNNSAECEHKVFTGIAELQEAYLMCVAHEDVDKAVNLCRVFTVLAESFQHQMIASSCGATAHYSIKSLDLVLNCVGHYDYEVAEITFRMWFQLSEDLFNRNNCTLSAHFKPYIERLITALYKHCQMEADHEGLLEDDDSFKDFRHKVSELIADVIFIVSSSSCFKQMFMILQQPNVTWESSEAALFVMQNVARNILPDENEVVPKVVEAILNLPETCHIAIRYTSINILGELCDWIDCHPESMQPILNFLLYALQQKGGLATAAANALQSICCASSNHLVPQITGLMEIARHMESFEIQRDASINLLKGIVGVVGFLQKEQVSTVLLDLCSYQVTPLDHLLSSNEAKVGRNDGSDPKYWLDRLAAVFRYAHANLQENETNPWATALTIYWPTLSKAMDKYQAENNVMERIVRCMRYAIRTTGRQAAPILEELVKQMIHVYNHHQHSCLLYLGSVLMDEFALDDVYVPGLLSMLQAFIEPTFNLLQRENGLKNNPDTVDDFFRLANRFVLRRPLDFLKSPLVQPIIQCALLACTLDHKDANLSVMKFFCSLLSSGRDLANPDSAAIQELIKQMVAVNGEALVVNLIYSSIFCLHSYMLSDVVDVFYELKKIDPKGFVDFLQSAVSALPKENSGGTVTATDDQLRNFMRRTTNADSSRHMTQALQDFAKLYR
ncbi:transportin-3 [Culicoides brevitarsis]|uniref:transportin-3 n=1 Tax=Culicoides brevitarsis TaxID=469753 RepID=UPI00307BB833